MSLTSTLIKLFDIGAIQFGSFTLKNGKKSPIYVDLAAACVAPKILQQIASLLYKKSKELSYDFITSMPPTPLLLSASIAMDEKIPLLPFQKETMDVLLTQEEFLEKKALIIDDLISSGTNIKAMAKTLRKKKIKVSDALVFIDCEQKGEENLHKEKITLHSLISLSEIVQILQLEKKVDPLSMQSVMEYIQKNG